MHGRPGGIVLAALLIGLFVQLFADRRCGITLRYHVVFARFGCGVRRGEARGVAGLWIRTAFGADCGRRRYQTRGERWATRENRTSTVMHADRGASCSPTLKFPSRITSVPARRQSRGSANITAKLASLRRNESERSAAPMTSRRSSLMVSLQMRGAAKWPASVDLPVPGSPVIRIR